MRYAENPLYDEAAVLALFRNEVRPRIDYVQNELGIRPIYFTSEMLSAASRAARIIEAAKLGEAGYKFGRENIASRFTAGLLGEIAACETLGLDWHDIVETEAGDTTRFQHDDLHRAGLAVGVKSGCVGLDANGNFLLNAPLMYGNERDPQVIIALYLRPDDGEPRGLYLGVATREIIVSGTDATGRYIKMAAAARRKVAFVAMSDLADITSVDALLAA